MTCSTCARIRRRIAEEAAKLKAAIARRPARTPNRDKGVTRRAAIGMLAGAAIATGLARHTLELVDDKPKPMTFRGVELVFCEGLTDELDPVEPPVYLINPKYSPPLQWWQEPIA